eukprot:1041629_1
MASPALDEKHGTGSISAYFNAAPARKTGIPYTKPRPETLRPSLPLSLKYSAKDKTVMRIPPKITRFPSENPRISNGGSPALFTPAPPIMALFGAAQSSSSAKR